MRSSRSCSSRDSLSASFALLPDDEESDPDEAEREAAAAFGRLPSWYPERPSPAGTFEDASLPPVFRLGFSWSSAIGLQRMIPVCEAVFQVYR